MPMRRLSRYRTQGDGPKCGARMTGERLSLEVIASEYRATAHREKLATARSRPRCSTRLAPISAIPPVSTPKWSLRR